jgi:hypothetical protein
MAFNVAPRGLACTIPTPLKIPNPRSHDPHLYQVAEAISTVRIHADRF